MNLDDPSELTEEEMIPPKGEQGDDLDLTPMVDVTFLLLIFFMITAAFALQKAIEVPPVSDEAAPTQTMEELEKDSIVIRIDGDNVFWISAPALGEDEVRATSNQEMLLKLREARGEDRSGPAKLLVQANGDARQEKVVVALDAGSGEGMEEIRLLCYEDEDFAL